MSSKEFSKKSHKKTAKIHMIHKLPKKMPKKGTYYSIESVDIISEYPELDGDIVKKYKKGKLVEQKFVSKEKLKELIHNSKKLGGKNKKGEPNQVVEVQVQDKTSFAQMVKEGFGFGIGFNLAEELIGSIFDSD